MGDQAKVVGALALPVSVAGFAAVCDDMAAKYGQGLVVSQPVGAYMLFVTAGSGDPARCWCDGCDGQRRIVLAAVGRTAALRARMIVCPDCGNKRCPRAACHALECTGSNEPGQDAVCVLTNHCVTGGAPDGGPDGVPHG